MAVSTDWVSTSIVLPAGGGDFNRFDKHATQKYAIGTRIVTNDGNEYVYSHFGADVNRGVFVATDASESSVVDTDNAVIAPASAQTTSDGTVGSKFLEVTLAGVTSNQFAGGTLVTTDDTGEGYTYRIKGNTATGDPTTGNIRIELYEKLQVAVDATTDIAIQGCIYQNLEIATAGTDTVLAGVTCSTMDVSEQAYGWIQTKGVVGVLQDGTIAIGDVVTLSDGVDGAVQTAAGGGTTIADLVAEQIVGSCLIAGDNTGHGVFYVNVT